MEVKLLDIQFGHWWITITGTQLIGNGHRAVFSKNWMLKKKNVCNYVSVKVLICTDSQAAIKALTDHQINSNWSGTAFNAFLTVPGRR